MSRGGGRGRSQLTFNAEALGIGRGDAPAAVLTPPPKYPPRLGKPRPLLGGPFHDYLLTQGKELDKKKSILGKSFFPKQQQQFEEGQFDDAEEIDWDQFPKELRPDYRKRMARKRQLKDDKGGRKKVKDVNKALEALEKKEASGKGNNEDDEKKENDDEDEENEEDKDKANAEESDIEEPDEEMDEGTDYANNYFDNGEGYLDEEDDNLDEGGIY